MERRLEIMDKDVTHPRLTITPERVTMKFPLHYDPTGKERTIEFFNKIFEDLKDSQDTLRGRLFKGVINMFSEEKIEFVYLGNIYKYENENNSFTDSPSVGDYIKRKNHTPFGDVMAIQVKSKHRAHKDPNSPLYYQIRINGKFTMKPEYVEPITPEEASELNRLWDELKLSDQRQLEGTNACIREDNGEPKQVYSGEGWKKPLFSMMMKRPGVLYEAYECLICKGVHIGKVQLQEKDDNLAL